MKNSVLLLLTFLLTGLTLEAQLNENNNFGDRDVIKSLFKCISNGNLQYSRLKSDSYQKLDSAIRPEYSKENYLYDNKGRIIQALYHRWEADSWTNVSQQNYHYNESGNQILIEDFQLDDLSEQLILGYQYEVSITDNMLYSLTMQERTDTLWTNIYKAEWSFDSINNLINEISFEWDNNVKEWQKNYISEYSHEKNQTLRHSSEWIEDEWSNTKKTSFMYDSIGNMTLYIDSTWDNSGSSWSQSGKGEYTYDTLHRPILTILSWPDSENQFINGRKIDYTYTYTSSPDRLVMPLFREYYYDGYIDITTASFTMQKWNTETNEWYTTYTIDKYYSDIELAEPDNILIVSIDTISSVSTDTIVISIPSNNTISFNITSDTSWTVVSDQEWLTVSQETGSDNSIIILTAEPNPTTTARMAIVTVTVTGAIDETKSNNSTILQSASMMETGLTTTTITVIQEGAITFINEIQPETIIMYPNPVSDILYLNTIMDKVNISIYDITGKMIINEHITNHKIDLSDLQNGIYTIKIETKSGIRTDRIVKQ